MSVNTYSKIFVGIKLSSLFKEVNEVVEEYEIHDKKGKPTGKTTKDKMVYGTFPNGKKVLLGEILDAPYHSPSIDFNKLHEVFEDIEEGDDTELELHYDPWRGLSDCDLDNILMGKVVYSNDEDNIQEIHSNKIIDAGKEVVDELLELYDYKGTTNVYLVQYSC